MQSASSYILLTLPKVSLQSSKESIAGTLSLECISSPPTHMQKHTESDREAYIVLHVEGRPFPIDPASPVSISVDDAGQRTYVFTPSGSGSGKEKASASDEVKITVMEYSDDVEMLDSVLTQYAEVTDHTATRAPHPPPPPYQHAPGSGNVGFEGMHIDNPALRGHLVLMDESSGEVVGELPDRLSFKEDPALVSDDKRLQKSGKEAGPVVLELPPDMYDAYTSGQPLPTAQVEGEELAEAREIFVRAVPPEEQDWITKGATIVSQAISASTSLLLTGLTSASTYYIKHSAPYAPPPPSASYVPRSKTPTAHPALTQAHFLSDKAAKASSVTAAYVERFIRKAVGAKDAGGSSSSSRAGSSTSLAPPINPSGYSVYKPKPRAGVPPPLFPSNSSRSRSVSPSPHGNGQPPELPPRKPLKTRERVLVSANLVLATVDDSARRVFEVGSERLGAVMGHKYGPQAQQSTHLATHTARNVVLVYVDVSGFARRALITKAGKEWMKARIGSRRTEAGQATPSAAGKI
ncbi:hypothetical protein BXZ70DRAFT_938612 [Cristinia sonorae]|uniref:Senescence domain-containing protein n=1 Tax=Cristinia sonorae TaxID=1940300 RepID=A0A8K0UNW0_9AGAR|nr:hypothetical protein BXZ70DRAFT_938612 [Cristinia sonorae]